jgi:hypothetical protein
MPKHKFVELCNLVIQSKHQAFVLEDSKSRRLLPIMRSLIV